MSDNTHGNGLEGEGTIAAFERMLDAFGADAGRWPADRRDAAEALLRRQDAVGVAARRALTEARALDRTLAVAPVFDNDRLASLTARIEAAARVPVVAKSNVVQLPCAGRSTLPSVAGSIVAPRRQWMAAAMLAASLLVGVVIGPGNTGLPALHDAADAIGLGGYVDQLALAPAEDDGSPDEDVL